jgi:hypothetical protein
MTVKQLERAQRLYREVLHELRIADRCAVVIGMETDFQVIRLEAVDSWLADPTRRPRFLFVADHKTTLGDVEWLLSR